MIPNPLKKKKTKVRIYHVKENKSVDENTYKGYLTKDSLVFFTGKWWQLWKNIEISRSELSAELIDDNGMYHIVKTTNDKKEITYQQIKRKMNVTLEELKKYAIVENDTITDTIRAFNEVKKTLTDSSLWKKIAPIIGLALLVICVIVLYVLLTKAGG